MQGEWQRELDTLRAVKGKSPLIERRKDELKLLIRTPPAPAPPVTRTAQERMMAQQKTAAPAAPFDRRVQKSEKEAPNDHNGTSKQSESESGAFYDSFDLPLKIHLVSVLLAVPLGTWQLGRKKGGSMHTRVGYTWAATMATAAASSFALRDIRDPAYKEQWADSSAGDGGRFASFGGLGDTLSGLSPVHVLSAWVLLTIPQGILSARAKDIKTHAKVMRYNFFGLAGVLVRVVRG